MAYAFKQKQSVAHNINRILKQEVQAALDALTNPGQLTGEMIHDIRKRIKKSRALIRLVRSELNKKDFQRENTYYRTIGQQLSSIRETTVMVKTLDRLRETQPDSMSPQLFTALHISLLHQQDQATGTFFEDLAQPKQLTKAFEQASQRFDGLSKCHNGFKAIAPNLKAIYRKTRKSLKVAVQAPTLNQLHELRKNVKTIWYFTRLLQPSWPGPFKAYAREFGRLGELLGNDHDFGLLAQMIESDHLRVRNKQSKETILAKLYEQRIQFQIQIFSLANHLLTEKTGDFVKRFRLQWKVWHAETSQKIANKQ
ncbi:CHAD domain-containing protein [Spirosoma litoris]